MVLRAGGSCVPGGVCLGQGPLAPYGCSRSGRDAAASEQLVEGLVTGSTTGIPQIHPGPAPWCLTHRRGGRLGWSRQHQEPRLLWRVPGTYFLCSGP